MVRGIARLPYTIQYENTEPFWYLIKNMVVWSLGMPLGIITMIAFVIAIRRFVTRSRDVGNQILLTWVVPLFIIHSVFSGLNFYDTLSPIIPFLHDFLQQDGCIRCNKSAKPDLSAVF